MIDVDILLNSLVKEKGSDLHIQTGFVPRLRIEGRLHYTNTLAITKADTECILDSMNILPIYMGRLYDQYSTDFKYTSRFNQSFRVNITRCSDGYKITYRNLNKTVPNLKDLGYEENLFNPILEMPQGLVLLTGPTNSGKSTTLASLMQSLATSKPRNIVTLEDPIEYQFNYGKSVLTRREFGVDFLDYPTAIHDAMRQDPDIIMVGEMRDAETIKSTILLAETGHLVLSSLHNNTIDDIEERILLPFNNEERGLIKIALRKALRFKMAQRLEINEMTNKLRVKYNYKYESKWEKD